MSSRLLRAGSRFAGSQTFRRMSTNPGVRTGASRSAALGVAAGAAGAFCIYKYRDSISAGIKLIEVVPNVQAATKYPPSQASVFTPTKDHALYLWIHLNGKADQKKCAKTVANLQSLVDAVCPADMKDEDNEVLAGVGFGPDLYSKVGPSASKKNYTFKERRGALGKMPAAGGDIFIHAKSNSVSKLFELAQKVMASFPEGSVAKFEDVYSFVYKNGRDLSGFIDGTENPADEEDRQAVAVEPETGGSYVITQKWVHKLDYIAKEKGANLEKFVGRTLDDSVELKSKALSSHVARMTGGADFNQKKVFQIVRQSMPYGNLHDKAGLFFIGYAASPDNLNFMLDRMVGLDKDGQSDDIMRLTECIASTYWYFPGEAELKKMK